jgi:cytochrome bd-type quinol oxidase subunit 1
MYRRSKGFTATLLAPSELVKFVHAAGPGSAAAATALMQLISWMAIKARAANMLSALLFQEYCHRLPLKRHLTRRDPFFSSLVIVLR